MAPSSASGADRYALLDEAGAAGIFFPRADRRPPPPSATDESVPVSDGVSLGARLYTADPAAPTLLYFHGNGEVAADYDDIAPMYHEAGANLCVVDFRGYGRSGGMPSFASLVGDAAPAVAWFHDTLDARGYGARRLIMGRSLGSQSALEAAAHHADRFAGLIIESGAGGVRRLLDRLGLADSPEAETLAAQHEQKLRAIRLPTLLIHGEWDDLVPLQTAVELYDLLEATERELVVIPRAGHNDLLWTGRTQYFDAVRRAVAGA